jgi:SMODS and SLOG-associating 2TM effector domain 1
VSGSLSEWQAGRASEAAADRSRAFHRFYLRLRIDEQLRFYQARRAEYAGAHRQAVVVRTALLFGAAAAGVVTQSTAGTARAAWAVAGALLAALAAAVTAFETLVGFPQLEKIYGDAARNLEEARLDWEDLDPEKVAVGEFERVEDVFRSERGQWGQLVVKSPAPASPATPTVVPSATPPAPG